MNSFRNEFPKDPLDYIISLCTVNSALVLRRCCKRYQSIVQIHPVWNQFLLKIFNQLNNHPFERFLELSRLRSVFRVPPSCFFKCEQFAIGKNVFATASFLMVRVYNVADNRLVSEIEAKRTDSLIFFTDNILSVNNTLIDIRSKKRITFECVISHNEKFIIIIGENKYKLFRCEPTLEPIEFDFKNKSDPWLEEHFLVYQTKLVCKIGNILNTNAHNLVTGKSIIINDLNENSRGWGFGPNQQFVNSLTGFSVPMPYTVQTMKLLGNFILFRQGSTFYYLNIENEHFGKLGDHQTHPINLVGYKELIFIIFEKFIKIFNTQTEEVISEISGVFYDIQWPFLIYNQSHLYHRELYHIPTQYTCHNLNREDHFVKSRTKFTYDRLNKGYHRYDYDIDSVKHIC